MSYCLIPLKEIGRIESLWEGQKNLHAEESTFFRDYFSAKKFNDRCKKFFDADTREVRIEVVFDSREDIAYCISSITVDDVGEIDSVFLKEKWRSQ